MTIQNNSSEDTHLENQKTDVVQVWLVTTDGEVLLRNNPRDKKEIMIKDLTIESKGILEAINEIEALWSVLCTEEDLKSVYRFECTKTNEINTGYILRVYLDEKNKSLIMDRFGGHFVDYNYIYDEINSCELDMDFKEAFFSFLAWMDKVYGYAPHLSFNY